MAGADSVEKLEDVIVRSAEQVAGQIKAAKEAVSTVIFGQDQVIENTLVRTGVNGFLPDEPEDFLAQLVILDVGQSLGEHVDEPPLSRR